MMNNTYSSIIVQSEQAWNFQWARTLFYLERQLSDEEKSIYLRKYSINMSDKSTALATSEAEADNDEHNDININITQTETKSSPENNNNNNNFVPGLMIIKRANCTRAEHKRRLVGLWQVSLVFISFLFLH